jgi:tRNA modification GTPase
VKIPAVDDTIVAVSSGWQPSPLGIVRLSGGDAFELVAGIGIGPPPTDLPSWTGHRVEWGDGSVLPVTAFWFAGPRSYSGQDVVEIHTCGCPPLLRELSARLMALGARRALPGEFTARAFLNGRLDAGQVEGVLALMQSVQEGEIRAGARLVRGSQRRRQAEVVERLTEVLALVEAGIDFVEEEDVRFVTPGEVIRVIDEVLAELNATSEAMPEGRSGRHHVALVGLPNAGKSTLFNALVGYQRALVSPVLGTTRDVLEAEAEIEGLAVVLQDCAGLGGSVDELELATHVASERAADRADLVLWIHAADREWTEPEIRICARLAERRRLLVRSKVDLDVGGGAGVVPTAFVDKVAVSVPLGVGLPRLRRAIAEQLGRLGQPGAGTDREGETRLVREALGRARLLAAESGEKELDSPELVSLELRQALELMTDLTEMTLGEDVLDVVFSRFCVGK